MTDVNQDIGVDSSDPLFGGDNARIRDPVTDESGDPKDLSTAQTVEFEVFDELGGTSQLKYTDGDSELSITGSGDNIVQVDLSQSDTDDLAPSDGMAFYEYRVRVKDNSGDRDTVTIGDFAVRAS